MVRESLVSLAEARGLFYATGAFAPLSSFLFRLLSPKSGMLRVVSVHSWNCCGSLLANRPRVWKILCRVWGSRATFLFGSGAFCPSTCFLSRQNEPHLMRLHSRVTRCKKLKGNRLHSLQKCSAAPESSLRHLATFSGNVAGVEAMPKPSLVALPQVALGRCTLGTFCRGCRSPSMGKSSPVWGFPPRPQTSPFLAIAETVGGDPSLGQPSEMALHSFGKPRTRERACAYECGHYSPNGTLSPGIVVCLVGKQILLFHSRSFQLFFLSILHRRFFTIFPVHLYEAGVSPTTRENFTERDSESEEIIPRWALEHG